MTRELMTGNLAAAWGARLAGVDYVPAFPITPQTEIIETLALWASRGEIEARVTLLESEHAMVTAAAAAAATGVRAFTATSSQGLLYAMEMLYATPGWRAPYVIVNVSRGLATPITLEPDHNDILAARDSGCLQIHCASCQEVVDTVLLAYRLAEHPAVRLPVLVNMDGYYLSFTREPVTLPEPAVARRFLPPYEALGVAFRATRPTTRGAAVLDSSRYSYFRYQIHLAALEALAAYEAIADEYVALTGRRYPAVETYRCEDADTLFFMIGSFATKARGAVDALRAAGMRVGLARPRLLRPYPAEAVRTLLRGRGAVAVIDQNIGFGLGGVLHAELAAALYGMPRPPVLVSFIGGLGGRDIAPEEFHEMAVIAHRAVHEGRAPPPRLLYTAGELRDMHAQQALAGAVREEGRP